MKKTLNKKKILMVLLFVLMVAAQLTRIICVFNQRKGYHSDEVWSYGFANSYYDPHIYLEVQDDPHLSDATVKNLNEWESGEKFWDYLVVNEGEEFTYDSVYYNQRGDMSPPLHTMILHTICSFFPNTFSWWYAFSINIVVFVLTQITFFTLVKTVTGKNWAAFLVCGYYGFTYAAVNTFVYLRQYALLTLLTLLLLYLLARMYQKDFHKVIPESIFSIVITALGGFTHYYFYVFACLLAGFTCFYLLFRRRWKALIGYALTMLAGAGAGILIYPYCLVSMMNGFHSYDGNFQLPFYWNFRTCLSLVLNEIVGVSWRVGKMTLAWMVVIIPSVIVIVLAVWYVCRKEKWMKRLLQRICEWLKNWKINCRRVLSGWNPFLIFTFIAAVGSIAIISKVSDVESMGILTDRYLFYVMPVILMTLGLFLIYLTRRYLPGKKSQAVVCAVVIVGCMALNQTRSGCNYLQFSGEKEDALSELMEDSDVIIAGTYAWRLEWYCYELRNVHSFFMTEWDGCIQYTEQLNSYKAEKGRDVYLILEEGICPVEKERKGTGNTILGFDNIDLLYRREGAIEVEDYLNYLRSEILWIEDVEYLEDRDTFCGILHIYKVHVKE